MKRALLLIVATLATSAFAAELYVPMSGDAALRIVNPTERRANVTIELLETAALAPSKTTHATLAPGEELRWNGSGFGAVRIVMSEPLTVNGGPLFDAQKAFAGGTLDARQTSIGVVNPANGEVVVGIELTSDGNLIDRVSIIVPARGMRFIRMDRLFDAFGDRLTFTSPQPVVIFGYDEEHSTFPAATTTSRHRVVAVAPAPQPQPQPQPSTPETIVITASKDATLYETGDGSLANSIGIHLFAGTTNGSQVRRALLAFDVASKIPPGSTITRASLTMHMTRTIAGTESIQLRRVLADWSEGTSNAGGARDGIGAQSKTSDPTWIHASFPSRAWSKAGGDFDAAADSTTDVSDFGNYTWGTSASMVARVQSWVDQPATNFGWLLVGPESTARTAKMFDSRQIAVEANRPSLTVEFTKP
ncbi:MAG: hypothetical protein QOI24_2136 [Acidobacteriota bacterium]|jgi:hypothetical protein|nr:hypothetical protein [Acidobacteriota bacterium]